ncbi:disease resistance protein RGA5-like [Phragmites australis]|uniref:disease resistance protein RGA5-like n=1 Tax=Phragmites australis TaxID=29695 RepID=UPI002D78BDD9|nr:disease resistance protein RGA5-like [Phragmites australis]XP_062201157.1 disease resistance protein RGA5-like [Phragmites australis]XP_062201158.1 disease resistance protein RGA5-like [Phragmites australis]
MELATAALGSLLPKLDTLLTDEYKLQKGVRGEIKFLQAEMESMQVALKKVSKLPAHQIDDDVKIWARNLKELSYDIEDSVDIFMVRIDDAPVGAKPHSFRRFFDRTIGLLTKAKTRHHIANDIKDIKSRINDVAARRERYKFEDIAAQPDTMVIDPRVPALFEEAAKLVGTDGPAEKISNLLTQGTDVQKQKLMVVSIVGVGGLGKTTIAKLVYERLRGQFDCRAFVSVSLKPNMKQILSSILRQVSKDRCTNAGEKEPEELIWSIREFLNDKRYFIVIDDVWNEKEWKLIKCALIDNNLGSKVIVTTRNVDVANLCSVNGAKYELDPLSDADSKRLLCKRIFNEVEGMHSELEEVAKKILKKCGGVPLAIITIASMLASLPNQAKYEWYRVYNSMGSGLEKDKTLESMREILSLSYNDLPYHLKPCLLYLSMFPEDSEIPRDRLVRMWAAEGFIIEQKGRNLYDIGEKYLTELVNRSMIQPVGKVEHGSATACRVHDMILDLIISLSAQENFVIISKGPQLISPKCSIRRLSLQGSNEEDSKEEQVILPAKVNMSHVRSLIAFNDDAFQWIPPLSSFSVLRVLDLKYIHSKSIDPKDLGSLHHLRYLALQGRKTMFRTFASRGELEAEFLEEIGNLQLLKTLDLWATNVNKLPTSIARLRQLETLIIDRGVKLPDGIGNLISLQELGWLDVCKSPNTLAELGNLTELRVLRIFGLGDINESYVKTFLQSLSNLHNIRTLFLEDRGQCIDLDCMSDQWRGPAHLQNFDATLSRLPRWFSTLSELSCLSIMMDVLRQDDLQLLGALPVLRLLKLQVALDCITDERLVIGIDAPFRSLVEFKFKHISRCWLVFGQGVMPRLQRLRLYFEVRKIEGVGFDIGLENLTSLKHVTVEINCYGARIREVEDVETKIRDVIEIHPNHPTLVLSREMTNSMVQDEDKGDREDTTACTLC